MMAAVAVGESRSEPVVMDIDDARVTGCRLTGLAPGRVYRVTVCATTSAGCGQTFTADLHSPPAGRTYIRARSYNPQHPTSRIAVQFHGAARLPLTV